MISMFWKSRHADLFARAINGSHTECEINLRQTAFHPVRGSTVSVVNSHASLISGRSRFHGTASYRTRSGEYITLLLFT